MPAVFHHISTTPSKPDAEAIATALNGDKDSLKRQLGAVDRFIEDLQG